jgi:hypothetical protein
MLASLLISTKCLKNKHKTFSNTSKKLNRREYKTILKGHYYPDTKASQRNNKKITVWYV